MDEFNIGRLTDFDFEVVCKDVFEEILGERLEIFAKGADGGIDLRHISPGGNRQIVIQCKHWMSSGGQALVRHMKFKEAPKVRRLNPTRYILATSADLSVAAKNAICTELGHFLAPIDLFGLHDLLSELRKRPHIVRRHLRLWLTSASVLQSLLSKEILTRSRDLADSLPETLRIYAPNPSLDRARELLERMRVCIIAGIPGIGKSTLARVLCASLAAAGYELYEISSDVDEVNKVWDDDVPQVFYYDDFLGQTTHPEKLQKNEERRLVSILRRVSRSGNKIAILTTREYILEQARRVYEELARADFDPLTCVLDLEDYGASVRAAILYNHVFFSSLHPQGKAAFAHPAAYRRILNHQNFNPRVIEGSLETAARLGYEPEDAVRLTMENLNDPSHVWDRVFHDHLDEGAVQLLETLLFMRREPAYSDLQKAWAKYRQTKGKPTESRVLVNAIRLTRGTMVRSASTYSPLAFQNPSVVDYMQNHFSTHPELLLDCIEAAVFFEQLEHIWRLAVSQRGEHLMREVVRNSDLFINSLTFNLYADPQAVAADRKPSDTVHRVNVCLAVAHHLQSEDLANYMCDVIGDGELTGTGADLEEASLLAITCSNSPYERLREIAPELAQGAAEALTYDMKEWKRATLAVDLLESLGDRVSAEYLELANKAKVRAAHRTLSGLYEEGMGAANPNSTELWDIIEFAQQWADPYLEEVYESMRVYELQERLESRRVDQLEAGRSQFEESAPHYQPVAEDEAAGMFELLREFAARVDDAGQERRATDDPWVLLD